MLPSLPTFFPLPLPKNKPPNKTQTEHIPLSPQVTKVDVFLKVALQYVRQNKDKT